MIIIAVVVIMIIINNNHRNHNNRLHPFTEHGNAHKLSHSKDERLITKNDVWLMGETVNSLRYNSVMSDFL
jgi:hypothetical protein